VNCSLAKLTFLFLGSIVFLASTPTSAQPQSEQSIPAEVQPDQQSPAEKQPQPPSPVESTTPAQNQDELFETIFGQPRTRDGVQRVVVPFLINGQESGQVLVLFSPGSITTVRFQAVSFLAQTAEILRPDIQEKLQAAVDSEGNLTLEVLRQNGLEAIFDERQLELQIQVPPAQRKTSVYNLREQGMPPEAKDALRPSPVSGYVNLRGGQNYVWSGKKATTTGRQPLRIDLEGALNFKGWVLEGSGTFTEGANPSWARGDLRLVRDAPDQALRYVVGELSIPVTGYQSSLPMLGAAVARNFSLQPYRVTRPVSKFEFFLETRSQVEVFINGRLVQTLQLPAGPQDIRDLPLSGGINDVQLVITDAVGRVQRLDFPAAVASDLLATGLEQFAYSFGFPSEAENGSESYNWDQPTLSLAYRRGLSNTLTMGGYLQGDPKQQLIGFEGAWATRYGNLGWDAALSHASDIGTGYAFRLRYEYLRLGKNDSSQPQFRLALEHQGPRFTTLDELAPRNDFSWDISANYSQRLFWGINSNLGANYQFGRAGASDTCGLSLGLSKSFGNGLGVNLNLSYRQDKTGNDEQAFLNLFWSLPRQRQSVIASTDVNATGSPSSQLTWNYSSRKTIGGINAALGILSTPNDYSLTGRLDYTGYRFTANLSHNFNLPRAEDESIGNLTRLTFGTALVFADGHFGWSRPVNNSFALVIPNNNLRGKIIGINPSGSGYTARADNLGSAVVPNLSSSYYVSKLQIEAPDLPLGYDLGPEVYNLLPSYKSGTLIRVGTEATVFVRGILLDTNGKPVPLQAGEVTSLSDPKWKPVILFTNKAGKFALEGFKPGRYELRLFTNQQSPISFEIPSGQAGVYDIGTLQVSTSL